MENDRILGLGSLILQGGFLSLSTLRRDDDTISSGGEEHAEAGQNDFTGLFF
jgi:hypothetical protein